MAASTVVGADAGRAMLQRLRQEAGGDGAPDIVFEPGGQIAVAVVAVAGGRWADWIDDATSRGRPQRRDAAHLVNEDLLAAGVGDDPPSAPRIVGLGIVRSWRVGARLPHSVAMGRWTLAQNHRHDRRQFVGVLDHDCLEDAALPGRICRNIGNLLIQRRFRGGWIGQCCALVVTLGQRGHALEGMRRWTFGWCAVGNHSQTILVLLFGRVDGRMARAVALGTWRADIIVVKYWNPTAGFRPLEATPSVAIQRA